MPPFAAFLLICSPHILSPRCLTFTKTHIFQFCRVTSVQAFRHFNGTLYLSEAVTWILMLSNGLRGGLDYREMQSLCELCEMESIDQTILSRGEKASQRYCNEVTSTLHSRSPFVEIQNFPVFNDFGIKRLNPPFSCSLCCTVRQKKIRDPNGNGKLFLSMNQCLLFSLQLKDNETKLM